MSSKMIINVKDARIVVPDTGTPDTGLFSISQSDGASNIGNMIVPMIGIFVVALVLFAVIVKFCKSRRQMRNKSLRFILAVGWL